MLNKIENVLVNVVRHTSKHLTRLECKLVADRSDEWQGPNTWGLVDGQRLALSDALDLPGFG